MEIFPQLIGKPERRRRGLNRTPRLSKSGIEYLDFSWGIFSGCENQLLGICQVKNCWAQGITYRFPNHYPQNFEPTYYPEALDSPKHLKKPSRIGVGWVGDVIGYGLEYKKQIFDTIRACPQHTFLFLTKNADRLVDWSPFPDNCDVGVTATDTFKIGEALGYLPKIEARIKYLSLEPLLDRILYVDITMLKVLNWLIIGSQTRPYRPPDIKSVEVIVRACDKAGVKVFLKDNIEPILHQLPQSCVGWKGYGEQTRRKLRQELPR